MRLHRWKYNKVPLIRHVMRRAEMQKIVNSTRKHKNKLQ
jgi:hypothetical protein